MAGFRDVADLIVSQQRFIATMQGRTATFSTFSDAQFDEATFEAQLTDDRMSTLICWYWILKLKARFLSGDYSEALAAADQGKTAAVGICRPVPCARLLLLHRADRVRRSTRTLRRMSSRAGAIFSTAHREQLREWAENYPPTFGDKHALVSGEIARLEGAGRRRHASVRASHQIGSRARLRAERGPRPRSRGGVLRRARRREHCAELSAKRAATAICAGALSARSGSSSSAIRVARGVGPVCAERDDRCTR